MPRGHPEKGWKLTAKRRRILAALAQESLSSPAGHAMAILADRIESDEALSSLAACVRGLVDLGFVALHETGAGRVDFINITNKGRQACGMPRRGRPLAAVPEQFPKLAAHQERFPPDVPELDYDLVLLHLIKAALHGIENGYRINAG